MTLLSLLLAAGFALVLLVNLAVFLLLATGVLPRYDPDLTARTRAHGDAVTVPANRRRTAPAADRQVV